MKQVFDILRRRWVAAQPEELIRQRYLRWMIQDLGYPPGLLIVERALSALPHLKGQVLPERRADILCLAKGIHPDWELYPLLLIECKAIPLGTSAQRQVCGYNHFLGAPFVAVANQDEILMAEQGQDQSLPQFEPGLHPYERLVERALLRP